MKLPCQRGPKARYDFESLIERDKPGFSKFNPGAHPPADNAALAPLRDDVPLVDPCSGHLSAGAEVDLGTEGRHEFVDQFYAPSGQWNSPGSTTRPQTAPIREDQPWNSRSISEAAVRAHFGGWTSAERIKPAVPKMPCTLKFYSFFPDRSASLKPSMPSEWKEQATRRYIYTSSAQRAYEDVPWDAKLPPRLRPPASSLEKMADALNQHFPCRYHCRPAMWQTVGTYWNKHQLRAKHDARKPISFTSPWPKSGQIPLYCGSIGSKNKDDVDCPDKEFTPLTLLRTTIPPYTPTARHSTIPGYTGRALYDRAPVPPAGSAGQSTDPHTAGTRHELQSTPFHGRQAPLSRMVTTVPPHNPYLRPKASHTHTHTHTLPSSLS